jgi:hypothetical protein
MRKEITHVLKRHDGQVNAKSMFEMKLLDVSVDICLAGSILQGFIDGPLCL